MNWVLMRYYEEIILFCINLETLPAVIEMYGVKYRLNTKSLQGCLQKFPD